MRMKKIVSVLCVAALLLNPLAGVIPLTAETVLAETLEEESVLAAPQNLREEDGYIVWDEVEDAYGYTLRILRDGSEWKRFTYYVNSVELDRLCYEQKLDFGEYTFEVCAFDEARNCSEYSNSVTAAYAPVLDAPANVRLGEENNRVYWDTVEAAVRYDVRIFRDDDDRTLYRSTYTFSTLCGMSGSSNGSYWISIRSVDRDYNVSGWTEPIMVTINEVEREKLEAPQNVRLDESGENILWDEVEGAEQYSVEINSWSERDSRYAYSYTKQTQLVNWKSYVCPLSKNVECRIAVDAYNSNLGWSSYSEYLYLPYEPVRDESLELPEDLLIENNQLYWNVADNAKAYWMFISANAKGIESYHWFVDEWTTTQISYSISYFPEGIYDIELFVVDENGNYNSKTYSVTLDTSHDETVWVPEVFYKFDTLLWDYDRLRHEDTEYFWCRIIDVKDSTVVRLDKEWSGYFYGLRELPDGKYTFETCVCECDREYKLGSWSTPIKILKHSGGLFDEENKSTEEITAPPEAADVPEEDRITSITINPAFNMKHKDGDAVELDLTKIKIKANEIYDEEGLKRAEEALGEEIKGNTHYNLLDLTLLYDGEDFSNGYEGLVQVIIPIPAGHRDKTFSCYRLTEVDGKTVKEKIDGEQTEDSYIIYLEHFSEYMLVGEGEEVHTHIYGETWETSETDHWKECTCGEKSENAEHTYGEWLTTKEATEAAEGTRERSCEICGYKQTETIPKLTQSSEGETDIPVDEGYTLKRGDDGLFYASKNGVIDTSEGFRIVSYDGAKFVTANGPVATDVTGLLQIGDEWYFLAEGHIITEYEGLALYGDEWFMVKDGKLNTGANGIINYDSGKFLVSDGRLRYDYSGLFQNTDGKWYFLADGMVQTQYSGLALYDGEWFYVINGILAEDYTGNVTYDGAQFYVVNGMLE